MSFVVYRPSVISSLGLPDELRELFPDGDAGERGLSVSLPPGRVVVPDEGDGGQAALWISDGPALPGLWSRLRAEHASSGLWPLLLAGLDDEPSRPWADGELWPQDMSVPEAPDPAELLRGWWHTYTQVDDDDMLSADERLAVTAPYGQQWPGLAPPSRWSVEPDRVADQYAQRMLASQPKLQLGLVAADLGVDALAVAGWSGPANYTNTGTICTVLRSWADRFGVRVIGAGYATLWLSVAAPPTSHDEALPIAAEHFAFCPDNIWQGPKPCTLAAYADRITGMNSWTFWWD